MILSCLLSCSWQLKDIRYLSRHGNSNRNEEDNLEVQSQCLFEGEIKWKPVELTGFDWLKKKRMCVLTRMIDRIACYWINCFFFMKNFILLFLMSHVVKWASNTHYQHSFLHFCFFLTQEPKNPSTTGAASHPTVWSGSCAESHPSGEFEVILAASSLGALHWHHFHVRNRLVFKGQRAHAFFFLLLLFPMFKKKRNFFLVWVYGVAWV